MEVQVISESNQKFLEPKGYLLEERRKVLESQGYRLVGNHSAIKTCHYCAAAIKGKNVCYKNTFYGIASWRCIQATVTLDFCNLRCRWCWRDISYTFPRHEKFNDPPQEIFEGLLREHKKAVVGFLGNKHTKQKLAHESMKPKHVALSLTGDACMYKRLPELIDTINGDGMTSFLVTNGTFPEMVEKLSAHQPTQMYITLPAPDEETYLKTTDPMAKDGWKKIKRSLQSLRKFERSVIRMTLAKDWNFKNPEGYAELINGCDFDFLELKSAMPVGYASFRMSRDQMPAHDEIKSFAQQIEKLTNFRVVDEKQDSRVVLLTKRDSTTRLLEV